MKRLVPVVLALALTACTTTDADRVKSFEQEVDQLRQTLHIPGMSAAIVKDQKVLWMHGTSGTSSATPPQARPAKTSRTTATSTTRSRR